jgi:hypothetical protein
MHFVAHDGIGFDIPDDWLSRSGLLTTARLRDHFAPAPDEHRETRLLDLLTVTSPVRNPGVRWFDEKRMLRILDGIICDQPMPPIEVDQPPGNPLPYRVRDGFHRYYVSVAAGLRRIPAVPAFVP